MAASTGVTTMSDAQIRQKLLALGHSAEGNRLILIERLEQVLALALESSLAEQNASTKNDKKKRRRKKKKGAKDSSETADADSADANMTDDVEIEYVPEAMPELSDPSLEAFASVFQKFAAREGGELDAPKSSAAPADEDTEMNLAEAKKESKDADSDDEDLGSDSETKKSSKRRLKKASRLSVAELKQLVKKPEVVEWVDVTAADPVLLAHLKAYRNSVPVPQHWQQKRKYLQGKRGIEKAAFELPDFIKQTGIMEIRSAVKEKEDAAKLKSKTRERVQPKMGKLDIDYQKLHDAFFRWQTKPKLSHHGDLYYEGKEFETKLKLKKPGNLSEELRTALNIPPLAPPPWLINMQRYGPPPSYPNIKIPGLNAPIPEGAQWGYHPGGWGKPPVDEFGRPLYGDVFGIMVQEAPVEHTAPVVRKLWGELDSEEEYEEEEEQEEEEEEENASDEDNEQLESGLETPSGLSSVPSGMETPDVIELRKSRVDEEPKELYKVIPEKQTSIRGFMGSQHIYDLTSASAVASSAVVETVPTTAKGAGLKRKHANPAGVEVALNPEDFEEGLDEEVLRKRYEEGAERDRNERGQEDFSDMVAEHAQKQSQKRKKMEGSKKETKKSYKEFKF